MLLALATLVVQGTTYATQTDQGQSTVGFAAPTTSNLGSVIYPVDPTDPQANSSNAMTYTYSAVPGTTVPLVPVDPSGKSAYLNQLPQAQTQGLTIDYAPSFDFATHQLSPTTQSYFAKAQTMQGMVLTTLTLPDGRTENIDSSTVRWNLSAPSVTFTDPKAYSNTTSPVLSGSSSSSYTTSTDTNGVVTQTFTDSSNGNTAGWKLTMVDASTYTKTVPNYVQVTDNRGTLTGWHLFPTLTAFISTDSKHDILKGAYINIPQRTGAMLAIGSVSVNPANVFSMIPYVITPGATGSSSGPAGATLLGAGVGLGSGTNWLNFGTVGNPASYSNMVSLVVPSGGALAKSYQATMTWTLSDTP